MKLKKWMIISICIFYALILTACNSANANADEDKAYEYNDKGLELMDEGKVEEAIKYFNKSLNSLSWYDEDLEKLSKNLKNYIWRNFSIESNRYCHV